MKFSFPFRRCLQNGALLIETLAASIIAMVTISAVLSLNSEVERVRHVAFRNAAFAAEALVTADRILQNLGIPSCPRRAGWNDVIMVRGTPCAVSFTLSGESAPGLVIPGLMRARVDIVSPEGLGTVSRTRLVKNNFAVSLATLGSMK